VSEPPSRIALVTGASRGLGYATALALGARGDQVIALARTVGGLEELADAIEAAGGPTPTLVPLSLADDAGLQRLGLVLHERWGRLDLVVHAAAHAAPLAPAPHLADKDFDQSVEVNLRGTARLVVMLQPLLAAAPAGRFVHVTDNRAGQPFFGAYGATKAAAEALVRSWAAETARIGPKVLLFHPNPMPTALRARFHPGEDRTPLTPCATEAARLLALLDETPAAREGRTEAAPG
jgi:NAD(P)-dependent dehydrogenase (short-subunit alcohol dehydrogenase family)